MAFPNQYARVSVFTGRTTRLWQNDFWFRLYGGLARDFDADAAAASFEAGTMMTWLACIGTDARWLGVRVEVNSQGRTFAGNTFTSSPGTGPSIALPNELAVVIRTVSFFPAPTKEGRVFLGGVAIAFLVNGAVTAAGRARISPLAILIQESGFIQGQEWGPCLRSRRDHALYAIDRAFLPPTQLFGYIGRRRARRSARDR